MLERIVESPRVTMPEALFNTETFQWEVRHKEMSLPDLLTVENADGVMKRMEDLEESYLQITVHMVKGLGRCIASLATLGAIMSAREEEEQGAG